MAKFKFLDKKRINSLSKTAGVYAFKKGKTLLYIGKAANVRQRVRNHFHKNGFRNNLFISEAEKIGYIKTDSEIEALLLEAELIRKHQPKFNVMWRDDKNYFYVVITKEDFPRVFLTHQPFEGATRGSPLRRVGPFVDGRALKQTLRVLRKVFPYRTCKTLPKKPCLWYDLGQCPAPCKKIYQNADISIFLKEYNKNIKNLVKVLQGEKRQVLRELKKEMGEMSKSQNFEKAARLRDQITALENVFAHSHIMEGVSLLPWKERNSFRALGLVLGSKITIKRIEGYDVSNIQGKQATGSMVVFEKGKPNKKEYRKFKVKIAGRPNDIAMLKEVLSRRLKHPEWSLPQVMLIDGGKAQLNAARQCLTYDVKHIQVVALAKRRNELYLENKKKPLLLKNLPQEVSNLILHLRDEAHRFAIKYHKGLRKKSLFDFQIKS